MEALKTTALMTPFGTIIAGLVAAAERSNELGKQTEIEKINSEAHRQSIALKMSEMQAKVAQEVSIAERIRSAQTVEIEEYYEGSSSGSAGAKIDDGVVTIGLAGEGRKVTKRVYRFVGKSVEGG